MGSCRLPAAALCLLLGAGCKAHDTEALGRIGRQLMEKGQRLVNLCRAQLAPGLPVNGLAPLEDRVGCRLRWDKTLADEAIQVKADGSVIELRGTVKELSQRRRAVDLAESTAGVERVSDLIEVEMKP